LADCVGDLTIYSCRVCHTFLFLLLGSMDREGVVFLAAEDASFRALR